MILREFEVKCPVKIPLHILTFPPIRRTLAWIIWIIKWEASASGVHKIPWLCKWAWICVMLGDFTPASKSGPVDGLRVTFLTGHRAKLKLWPVLIQNKIQKDTTELDIYFLNDIKVFQDNKMFYPTIKSYVNFMKMSKLRKINSSNNYIFKQKTSRLVCCSLSRKALVRLPNRIKQSVRQTKQ